MTSQDTAINPPQKKQTGAQARVPESVSFSLLFLYIVFCTSFLCAIIPISSASVFSLMICICTLAGAYTYRVRAKKKKNRIIIAHTSYMITTFWRACVLLLITGFIGFLYMLVMVDYAPLETCASSVVSAFNRAHFQSLPKILNYCGELIVKKNSLNIHVAGLIAFSPVFLYVLWRCVRGSMLLAFSKTQLNEGSALKKNSE